MDGCGRLFGLCFSCLFPPTNVSGLVDFARLFDASTGRPRATGAILDGLVDSGRTVYPIDDLEWVFTACRRDEYHDPRLLAIHSITGREHSVPGNQTRTKRSLFRA